MAPFRLANRSLVSM